MTSQKKDEEKMGKNKTSTLEIVTLSFISLVLLGFLGYFLYDSSVIIGKCRNNIPVENCNNPAGDFAVEPDTRSVNVETGCHADENQPCIFQNIATVSEAIKKCNSLGNKCNRFMYDNNRMAVVALTGDTIPSPGNHMFLRQNGITFQGQGNPNNSYKNVNVPGENTSITSAPSTFSSLFSTFASTFTYSGSPSSSGSGGAAGGGGGSYGGGSGGGGGGY